MAPAKTFDKASWHLAGEVPPGTTERQAFTHIGIYIAWLIQRELFDPRFFETIPDGPRYLQEVTRTARTPTALRKLLDGTLPSELMNGVGRAFTDWYYADDHALYLDDWVEEFAELADQYAVPDTSEALRRIGPRIDQRFAAWSLQRNAASDEVESRRYDDDLAAASRAITSLGGRVIPPSAVADAATSRGVLDRTLARETLESLDLSKSSSHANRALVARLASGGISDSQSMVLRTALDSQDPVVVAIAANALNQNGRDDAFPDIVRAISRGPISNDRAGWSAMCRAALEMATRIGGPATRQVEKAIDAGRPRRARRQATGP